MNTSSAPINAAASAPAGPGSPPAGSGGPVLVLARCSTPSGTDAYRLAADDLWNACIELARHGRDFRSHLPSRAQIRELLRQAPPVRSRPSTDAGTQTDLVNRFVEIDLRQQCGLYVVVSAGTGKKLDEDLLQPFVTRCAAVARAIRPSLLFANSMKRWSRDAWGLAPLAQAMKAVPGSSIGDRNVGIIPMGASADIVAFLTTRFGEDEAADIPVRTRTGTSNKTGRAMVDGRVAYAASAAPPPGMALIRFKEGAGIGRMELILETPALMPAEAETAGGFPKVFDHAGNHVDQVENVRWALKKLAAGWTHRCIAEGLIARQYSTTGLRRSRGQLDAVYILRHNPINVTSTITGRLETYRTGELPINLGVEGVEDFVITGCFPVDGRPWASDAVFDKIDRRMTKGQKRHNSRAESTFTGLDVTVDGVAARLRACEVPDTYRCMLPPDYRVSAPGGVRVPHHELATLIREAVAEAGDGILAVVDGDPRDDDETLSTRQQITDTRARLAHLETVRDTCEAQLSETDEQGKRIVTGALLKKIGEDYNTADADIGTTKSRLDQLQRDLDLAKAQRRRRDAQAQTDQLLHIVSSLRNPRDLTYRTLWQETLRDINIAAVKITRGGRRGRRVTITGNLHFSDAGTEYSIPMRHEFHYGHVALLSDKVTDVLDQMADGTPFSQIRPSPLRLRGEIAKRLGIPADRFYATQIDDPLLLRCVMATVHNRERRSNIEIAEALGVEPGLIDRVEQVHKDLIGREQILWRQGALTPQVERLFVAASKNSGLVPYEQFVPHEWASFSGLQRAIHRSRSEWTTRRGVGIQLSACGQCGSHRRARPSLVYMEGLLCLDCLHDTGGIEWKAEHLRFVPNLEVWTDG